MNNYIFILIYNAETKKFLFFFLFIINLIYMVLCFPLVNRIFINLNFTNILYVPNYLSKMRLNKFLSFTF